MRKQYWIFIFLFVLLIHIGSMIAGWLFVEQATKALLIPILIAYFISETKAVLSPLKKWVLLALTFSWVGDVLLLFVEKDAAFFLAGLASFLIAHIFYIVFFHLIRLEQQVQSRPVLVMPVLIYYVALMFMLSPHLGGMKLPVRIYGVVICFMLMLAAHMLFIKNRKAGLILLTGALLFVISDSVLAINKFYGAFSGAGIIIMLTYGAAQLLITTGAIDYLDKKELTE
ncbi:MAG: lysoplasmalogenase [Chitinophagaceae bacterium]